MEIHSVAFTQDNQSAFISDWNGSIKMIKWKPNAETEHDFDFTKEFKRVGNTVTYDICLTRDDKHLLIGSWNRCSVMNTETLNVTKEFILGSYCKGIKLLHGGPHAIISDQDAVLTIIDTETMEISQTHKDVANGNNLLRMH